MSEIILFFFSTFAAGFLGTIPPGIVNLMAIRISVESGMRSSLSFSAGYTLLEMIYGFLAIVVLHLLTAYLKEIALAIHIASIPILVGYGVSMLRTKPDMSVTDDEGLQKSHGHFFRYGIKLGLLNPMALPYWITFGTLTIGMFQDFSPVIISTFLIALGLGAILLLFIYAAGGLAIRKFLETRGDQMNKILGWFFITLALYQLLLLFYSVFYESSI